MRQRDLVVLSGLLLLLCLTRWPLAPKYLFYFDSVNMAYALEHFSPPEHKPQPPGYPLFVGLCRGIHVLGASVEHTFLWAGILGGVLTGWMLWRFGTDLGRPRAGLLAAILYSFTPVFWFNSLTNQSRGYSAVASAGTAWFCWRAAQPASHPGWLMGAAGFVGLMAGFRPVETLMLTPLLLWAIWKRRPRPRDVALAAVLGAVPVAAWGWVLLDASGGLQAFLTMMSNYSNEQRVFAAGTAASPWKVLFKSVEWVGAIHLTALIPFVWAYGWKWGGRVGMAPIGGFALFTTVWMAPGIAFQVVGHAADPCHTLASVTAVCLLGGLALDRLPRYAAWAALIVACVLCAEVFFSPLRGAARATSYHVISGVTRQVNPALEAIRAMERAGPPTVLITDSLVTWRHIRYYFPSADIWMRDRVGVHSPSGATTFPTGDTSGVLVLDRYGPRFGIRESDLARK
ncbi:MAG: glycosyltransferase family 39 protein [Bryobacterales bacterium]|jgi:hypothetical protein|nr:glycosyltransferase family 39 protein [Bryobacterales bacterium]